MAKVSVKLTACRHCRIEMERIALADGSMVLTCVTCNTVGLEAEIVQGGRMRPAGAALRLAAQNAPRAVRVAASGRRKKIA